jgi:hypothetical protein
LVQLAAPATPANAAKRENAMRFSIQTTPAYELAVELRHTGYGQHLRLISLMPGARRPEEQVRFQAVLGTPELRILRDAIDQVLSRASSNEVPAHTD